MTSAKFQFELHGRTPVVYCTTTGQSIEFDDFMAGNYSPRLKDEMTHAYRTVMGRDWVAPHGFYSEEP